MDRDELYTATQYIVVIMLHQYFYPIDLATATAEEINNKEKHSVERYRFDALFHARVDKLTHLLVDKTLSLFAPELAAAEKWRVLEKKYPNFCKRFDVTIDALEGEGEKG